MHNIIAALRHNDRVSEIELWRVPSLLLEKVLVAMQEPFSALVDLRLASKDEPAPVVPDLFLGISAPCLRNLSLRSIPFPGLPKLLLSAAHLIDLSLRDIPHSGYFSPTALVNCLSTLTGLKKLIVEFESPKSFPNRESRSLPSPTLSVFPALTYFKFKGVSEYLEDLVTQIDAPLLDSLGITFFHQLVFDTPHISQFLSRTPKFKALDEARVVFEDRAVQVALPLPSRISDDESLRLGISCKESEWQLSSLAQICTLFFPSLSTVEHLYIYEDRYWPPRWQDDTESAQWLELLDPFSTAKNLYLSTEVVPHIARALRQIDGERVTEVLPALQTLFLEGLRENINLLEPFLSARQFFGHPIVVSHWDRE